MKYKQFFPIIGLLTMFCFSFIPINEKPENIEPEIKIKNEAFAEFLSHFEKVDLPYDIGLDDFKNYDELRKKKKPQEKTVSQRKLSLVSNSEFIPGGFQMTMSRMGPPPLEAIVRFYPHDDMVAVVYSSQMSFGIGLDKSIILVLYDLSGNILSQNNEVVSGNQIAFSSAEKTGTCHIDQKGHIWMNTYDNCWREDIWEKRPEGNELVDFTLAETKVFKINKEGHVIEMKKYPTMSRASLN